MRLIIVKAEKEANQLLDSVKKIIKDSIGEVPFEMEKVDVIYGRDEYVITASIYIPNAEPEEVK